PRLDKFWEGLYNAIANCNNLLVNIENKNAEDFIDGLQEKNLIKGEALALRGFLHFELLRLYAPSIAVDAQGKYIPYYTTYPSHGESKISSMEVLNRAAEDLKQGRDLVAPYDTITAGYSAFASPEARLLSNNYNGAFYSRRGTRLNYFAITGILARLYLYANDKTNALKYAQEIVPYTLNTTPLKYYFYFTPESALDLNVPEKRNRRLTHDIILGFYNRLTLDNFENTIGKSAGVFISDAANLFVPDTDDFRFSRLTEGSGANLISIKYKRGGNTYNMDNTVGRIIPILRLSEIYYILGECLIDTDPAQAVNYLNLVRKGRGINGNPLSTPISKQSYMDALVRDARKEFIGEGQLFFMYKRLNIPAIGNNGLGVEMGEKFVLPIPVSENNF
ncbi:MAG TPA: RagB/SusD family nutrient uptake outer membrane protein, partial [Parasegetibacter sp.]